MILLEASHPPKNIFRAYYICAYYDLFGSLMVDVTYGRIGSKGKCSTFFMEHPNDAKAFIMQLLKKRETSLKRIGVSYLLKYYAGHWDMEEVLFPFRQTLLFDEQLPLPEKKQPFKEIIKEGEGLFCNEPSPLLRSSLLFENPYYIN
ncbi:MAG: hypothetical protein V4525_08165 [Pseudomonadota bacterium]